MRLCRLIAFTALALACEPVVKEFESNGVRGAVASPDGKTVVIVKASNCNVEAITVKVRFRREDAASGFRYAVKTAPVSRCQIEPVMVLFGRESFERPILVAIQELVVANNASSPVF